MRRLPFIIIVLTFAMNHELNSKPIRRSRIPRNAFRNESRLWPKATVPYTIDGAYSQKERILITTALKEIESASCIRFKTQILEEAYVEIVRGKGCRSVVGYTGRRQRLILGHGCIWAGKVLHELLHTLGFFHEHTRPDRDSFITVLYSNIKNASLNNFRKMSEEKVTTFGMPYDYSSVLHYHDREFAIDRSMKTLRPLVNETAIFGKAQKMSPMDILKLNRLYRCPKTHKEIMDEGSGLTELEDNFIVVSPGDKYKLR